MAGLRPEIGQWITCICERVQTITFKFNGPGSLSHVPSECNAFELGGDSWYFQLQSHLHLSMHRVRVPAILNSGILSEVEIEITVNVLVSDSRTYLITDLVDHIWGAEPI